MTKMEERLAAAVIPDDQPITKMIEAQAIAHTLSEPSKMPGFGYSTPAKNCQVGSKLREVKGSVCESCYAMKGRYTFSNVSQALEKRLAGIGHPRWVEAMVFQINKVRSKPGGEFFRWHDSGDLQSVEHLDKICEIARQTPETTHWLPTREVKMVADYEGKIPKNLTIRISAPMVGTRLNVNKAVTSSVGAEDKPGFECGAYTRGGECGPCRACWDPKVKNVNYPLH